MEYEFLYHALDVGRCKLCKVSSIAIYTKPLHKNDWALSHENYVTLRCMRTAMHMKIRGADF
jgi:hypothetical protein